MKTKIEINLGNTILGLYKYSDDLERIVDDTIKRNEFIHVAEIARQTGISERSVRRRITSLANANNVWTCKIGGYRFCHSFKKVSVGPYVLNIDY